jgi:hypothetical protein
MKTGAPRISRRSVSLAAAGVLALLLTACTGGGGGYLPPDDVFNGKASFGFHFSCRDPGGMNPPTGQLRIQLAYTDHSTSPFLGVPLSIHGTADELDPVVESMFCIGQNPPPDGNTLTFLGTYRTTGPPPPGFPQACPKRATPTSPLCRFEVTVQDNDGNLGPSKGDFFSIRLSSSTELVGELDPDTVFYARAGYLAGGNLTVK